MSTQADPFGIGAAQRFQIGSKTGDPSQISRRGILSYLPIFMQGATSTDNGMLWGGLAAVQQQKRLEQYAAYVAEQERQARMKQAEDEAINALLAKQANPMLGGIQSIGQNVRGDLLQQGRDAYGQLANANMYNQSLQNPNRIPEIDPYAPVSQQQALQEMLAKRQQGYVDSKATEQAYGDYLQQGSQFSRGQYGAPMPQGQPQQPQTGGLQQGQLQLPEGTYQAGVSQQSLPQYALDASRVNPNFLPTVDPTTITGGYNKGADIYGNVQNFNLDVRQQKEVERANKADESIGWYNAKTGRINANKPSGGSGNPYSALNSQQQFYADKIGLIDKELKSMGYIGQDGTLKADAIQEQLSAQIGGNWITGEKPKPDTGVRNKAQRAQMLLQQREQLMSGLGVGGVGQPAQPRQPAAIPKFSDWKKGR